MFKSPVTYVCVLFFVFCMAATPSYANTSVDAESVYCKIEVHKSRGSRGFLGFLKDTFTCNVKVEYEAEDIHLDGSTDIEVSFEDGSNLVEKLYGWFDKE
jgi:hypothetical protein